MRNLKKVLALVLAMAMSLSLAVTAGAAFTDQDAVNYDVAVDTMVELGVINGYTDGSFKPANTVTRAEAAKMIAYTVAGADETTINYYDGATKFEDVTGSYAWASAAVNYCAGKDIIAGRSETVFDPGASVTGAELTKMVLVALGYEPETANKAETLVGANWMTNAISMGLKLGLYEGLNNDFVATQAANREETAQIIFNALGANTVDVRVAIDDYYVYETGAKLLADAFGATATETFDASGRPATEYTNFNDKDIEDILITEYADFTFDTAMEEDDLFKALGASGISGGVKYVVMDKIFQDGTQVAAAAGYTAADKVAGEKDVVSYYAETADSDAAYKPSVIIAKGDDSNIAGFGNGVTVEIFETDEANHYIMVAIREYIGTVTGVTKADENKGTERTITIDKVGTFETEDFARQDVVLYTMDKDGIASVKAAPSISGKITKIANGDTYTIDGVAYKLSQTNNLKADELAMSKSGSWYVDSCGNLISFKEADEADVFYGYLLKYEASTGADAGLLGDGAANAGEKFKFVDANGETVILDGAYETNKDGDIDQFVASNIKGGKNAISSVDFSGDSGILFKYELNSKGEISKVYDATAGGDTIEVTKGSAQVGGSYSGHMGDKTVVFYVDKTDADEVAVYVGYTNAADNKGTLKGFFATNNLLDALLVSVDSVAAQSDEDYVYFASLDVETEENEDGDTIYTYTDVYVNGVAGKLQFKNSEAVDSKDNAVVAGGVYTYTVDTSDEMATLESENLIATATTITDIQSTYFVAGGNFYFDSNTTYYEIDTDNDTMTKVETLPELSDNGAYVVKKLFVEDGTKDDPAVVVFFVVE